MSESGKRADRPSLEAGGGENDSSTKFPLWVRILAVAYVLSRAIGPVGFFALSAAACFVWVKGRELSGLVLGLWLGGLACPLFCAAFRWWFRRLGQRRWPDPEPNAAPSRGGD
jgi:hypothetical protein